MLFELKALKLPVIAILIHSEFPTSMATFRFFSMMPSTPSCVACFSIHFFGGHLSHQSLVINQAGPCIDWKRLCICPILTCKMSQDDKCLMWSRCLPMFSLLSREYFKGITWDTSLKCEMDESWRNPNINDTGVAWCFMVSSAFIHLTYFRQKKTSACVRSTHTKGFLLAPPACFTAKSMVSYQLSWCLKLVLSSDFFWTWKTKTVLGKYFTSNLNQHIINGLIPTNLANDLWNCCGISSLLTRDCSPAIKTCHFSIRFRLCLVKWTNQN